MKIKSSLGAHVTGIFRRSCFVRTKRGWNRTILMIHLKWVVDDSLIQFRASPHVLGGAVRLMSCTLRLELRGCMNREEAPSVPANKRNREGGSVLHRGCTGLRPKSCPNHTKSLERNESLKVKLRFLFFRFKGFRDGVVRGCGSVWGNSGTLRPNVTG